MTEKQEDFEVVEVTKYYIRRGDVVETKAYDFISKGTCYGLHPVELNGKLGFINSKGEEVIPIVYDIDNRAHGWTSSMQTNGYIQLKKDGMSGLIKPDGTEAVPFKWGRIDIYHLSEDLLPVAIETETSGVFVWGFLNIKTDEVQVEPAYDEVQWFSNGYAPVRIKNNWGLIDINGNIIVPIKYLLDAYFIDDFAIVHEGGYYIKNSLSHRYIYNSNWKIVNKQGYEIVTDCSEIKRQGFNTFILVRDKDGTSVKAKTVRQFITFPEYIIVIDDGVYVEKHYIGGGTWSAIDYTGKPITISDSELKKVKENLIAKK